MTGADIPLLALLGVTLLLAVFLALAEASLLRVTEYRAKALSEEGGRAASRLAQLVERLPEVLNLILLLALLSQIGAATITGILAQRWFGNLGVTVASVVLTVVLYIYGEAIPKTYAVRHAESTALRVSGPISALERLLRPLVSLLIWVADVQMPGKGVTTSPTVTEEELRLLAYRAAHEGEITEEDLELIERAFRFGDRSADDIMVPRPDIVAVEIHDGIERALEVALSTGHRRIPVYRETLEHIIGVVRLRDLTESRGRGEADLSALLVEPLVVPESKSITSLLKEMQEQNNHVAVVVDEYGVTAGLVTVEDVAEELLGTISDGEEPARLEAAGEHRWRAPGSLPVEDLDELGLDVPDGDWNTVAGLMIGIAGRLLEPGDDVEIDGFRLTAETVRRRRVIRVSIERIGSVRTPPGSGRSAD